MSGLHPTRAGVTLVELILALGLFALLSVALVQLLDTTLSVWESAELEREQLEREAALVEWIQRDFEFVESGPDGDLLFDWELVDVNGDGIATRPIPRLRLVRSASVEDLTRLGQRLPMDDSGETARPPVSARPLVEVVWYLDTPINDPEEPPIGVGVLLRGEQLVEAPGSYFEPNAFSGAGDLEVGPAEVIAGGALHFEVLFASQTSSLLNGWRPGTTLASVSTAWDARDGERPNLERTSLNRMAPGSPSFDDRPILPRRVRVLIELESTDDAERRPRLTRQVEPDDTLLTITDSKRLPEEGAFVLLGEEWVRVRNTSGRDLTVTRGERGTRPLTQKVGTPLHFGHTIQRDFVIPQHREDWGL